MSLRRNGLTVPSEMYITFYTVSRDCERPPVSHCYQCNLPQEADKDHSAVTAGTAVSLSNREAHIVSKSFRCMDKPDYGDFYT